ncbi:MAG: ATP-binding protein [Polyangiaceae bacterium]
MTSHDLTSHDLTSYDLSMFLGRERELEALRQQFQGSGGAFVVVYGRRRVGKSELLLEFVRDKAAVYFVGKKAPAALQRAELAREAAALLQQPLLEHATSDWKQLLSAIVEQHRGGGRLVLVLDEFQWMAEASPELPSVLQELWDRHWQHSKKIMLVLCGSFIGFMEREVLGKQSPLFGRRTAQMLLQPFDALEAARFHRGWSLVDRARARFVCGGIPGYLKRFDASLSFEKNLERELLDEFAPLYREPEFLLREELRDVQNYHAVLRTIAAGAHATKDIAKSAGVEERSLHYYLQQLVDLGYVARRYPLTSGKANVRAVRFVLDDPLLRFWFRFVFPNNSYIQHMGPARALRDRIRPELDSYFGGCFERLCRESLPRLYAREGVSASFQIGEYWARDVQIDVVGLRDDGWTDLGECKWGSVRSAKALASELEAKVPRYPNPRGASLGRRFFLRTKPKGDLPPGRWHDLADLYHD